MKKQKQIENIIERELKIKKRHKIKLILCLIYAIIIQVFFIALNVNYMSVASETFSTNVKISYTIFIFIAILMFEVAYKKRKKDLAITGIEFIVLALHVLLIGKSVEEANDNEKINILLTSYVWIIYYCLKALIVQTQENRRKLKQISDISEIVKEEKPVKKVAKKRKK